MAANDYSVTVGATTWLNDSATTKVDKVKVHCIENRPSRAMAELVDPSTAVSPALGNTFIVKFKGNTNPDFEGVVDSFKRRGSSLVIEGEDIMGKLRGQVFNEVFMRNYILNGPLSIATWSSSYPYPNWDYGIYASTIQFPFLRLYTDEAYTYKQKCTSTTLLGLGAGNNPTTTANYHYAQMFVAESHSVYSIDFGVVRTSGVGATNAKLHIVKNNEDSSASTKYNRPLTDNGSPAAFQTVASSTDTALADGASATHTTFAVSAFLIPGVKYWLVCERSSDSSTNSIECYGYDGGAAKPVSASMNYGSSHDVTTWTVDTGRTIKFTMTDARSLVERKEILDYNIDTINQKVAFSGTSGYLPNSGQGLWMFTADGTETVVGSGKPVNYILARAGVSPVNIDTTNITATYGIIPIRRLDGVMALEEILVNHYSDAVYGSTGTRRGRFFVSSTTGTSTFYAKQEKLASDSSWKTIANGKDSDDAIVLSRSLSKTVRLSANRVVVFGKDLAGNSVSGMAEDLTLRSTVGARLRLEHDEKAISSTEARAIAKGFLDGDYDAGWRGEIVVSGFWPEASGYQDITGNTFNNIITYNDSDLGISSQKFKVWETIVEADKSGPRTTLVVSKPETKTSGVRALIESDERIHRREAVEVDNDVLVIVADTTGTPAGTFAEMQRSGTAAVSWDTKPERVPVKSLGGNIYAVVWPAFYVNPTPKAFGAAGSNRDLTDIKFYSKANSFASGDSLQYTHTFGTDDKICPTVIHRVHFLTNET